MLAVFFAFGISVKSILKLADLFKREPKNEDENELASLKAKAAEQPGFKLNEGVPVVHHDERGAPAQAAKLATLKNTAQKLNY